MQPCVSMRASRRNGTLYVGGIWEHKVDIIDGFTRRYRVHSLVSAELHSTTAEAIMRENRIKQWRRSWKIALIERANPRWCDLHGEIGECLPVASGPPLSPG
jgi:putative endonuclease